MQPLEELRKGLCYFCGDPHEDIYENTTWFYRTNTYFCMVAHTVCTIKEAPFFANLRYYDSKIDICRCVLCGDLINVTLGYEAVLIRNYRYKSKTYIDNCTGFCVPCFKASAGGRLFERCIILTPISVVFVV